jgi:hypothetical protein
MHLLSEFIDHDLYLRCTFFGNVKNSDIFFYQGKFNLNLTGRIAHP